VCGAGPCPGGPTFPTGIGNTRAPLVLQGCMDRRGYAVPCSLSDTVADVLHRYHSARPENRAQVVSISPNDACTPFRARRWPQTSWSSCRPRRSRSAASTSRRTPRSPAAAWWIMIYDAVSAPADGAVTPAKCYAMPSGTTATTPAFGQRIKFKTGIVIGVSTNGCFTKAASVHAFISGDFR
jgi:hypothetical protein